MLEQTANGSTCLDSAQDYARYLDLLTFVFSRLMECYRHESQGQYEAESIRTALAKMVYSIEAWKKKYTYNPAHSLKVDLTSSGFPNYQEISSLGTDLLRRRERLRELPPAAVLRQAMLDYLFKYRSEPNELLWQMSEREYCGMLDEGRLLLGFTPGECVLRGENARTRAYVFSWTCYDFKTNRPYIHLLTFEQDAQAEPLHAMGAASHQFREVVKAEGSRAPEVGLLALAIDDDIESIHPKVLKRICIGPLYSSFTRLNGDPLAHLLSRYREDEKDFILLLKDEIVFSETQKELPARFFSPRRVREIFYIPEEDLDCYQHKASMIHRYMLLPHTVLQQMAAGDEPEEYRDYRKLSFGREGEVYGV